MSAKHLLLVGSLALLVSGCSGCGGENKSRSPAPLNKDLLPGKWKSAVDPAAVDFQFIASYDFAPDNTAKVTIVGMKQDLPAKYAWSGDRTLELEYPAAADIRQAYAAAAKAYKDRFMERVKAKQIPDKAVASLSAIRDKLPDKETFTVAISENPVQLFLINDSGQRTFTKVN